MSIDELDPVIHAPARLRIVVTLSALAAGADLSVSRLQELLGLTPGTLITHLRKLEDAGYVTTVKSGAGVTARTGVSLTAEGRAALVARERVGDDGGRVGEQERAADALHDAPEDQPQRGRDSLHPGDSQRDRGDGEDRKADVVHPDPAEHVAKPPE